MAAFGKDGGAHYAFCISPRRAIDRGPCQTAVGHFQPFDAGMKIGDNPRRTREVLFSFTNESTPDGPHSR